MAKRGDIAAFETLVLEYEKLVYSVSLRMLGSNEDACDTVQEVFLRMYRNIQSFDDSKHLKNWLCRVTNNLCIDTLRQRRRGLGGHSSEALYNLETILEAYPETQLSAEEQAILNEQRTLLERSLSKLPSGYRIMIILRDINNLSYNEIAEITRTSLGTVKSRISRSRNRLREIYSKEQKPLKIVKLDKSSVRRES